MICYYHFSGVVSDAMWSANLRMNETMEAGPYPEREGEPDCSYYIRTGLCRFGVTCRFNHPANRKLVRKLQLLLIFLFSCLMLIVFLVSQYLHDISYELVRIWYIYVVSYPLRKLTDQKIKRKKEEGEKQIERHKEREQRIGRPLDFSALSQSL